MEIIVQIKEVYGNKLVYPVCDKAKEFAYIAQTKTIPPISNSIYSIENKNIKRR
jgi:hypothetical protein